MVVAEGGPLPVEISSPWSRLEALSQQAGEPVRGGYSGPTRAVPVRAAWWLGCWREKVGEG